MTNVTLKGKSLLDHDHRLEPEGINLTFFGENTTKLLAADEAASYSLRKLAGSLENSSVVYHNPSEALLAEFMYQRGPRKFLGMDWEVWNSIVVAILVGVVCVLGYRQFGFQRMLTSQRDLIKTLGVASVLLPKSQAQSLRQKSTVMTSTVSTITFDLDYWRSLLQKDVTIFWLMIILLGKLILFAINLACQANRRRSFIYIGMSTDTSLYLLKYVAMPDPNRLYAIRVWSQSTKLKLVNCLFFGYIKFEGKRWTLEHTRTQTSITLPARIFVGWWDITKIKMFLSDTTCVVSPVVVHTHEQIRRQLPLTSVEGERLNEPQEPPRYNDTYV
jgi:hypothetical protein